MKWWEKCVYSSCRKVLCSQGKPSLLHNLTCSRDGNRRLFFMWSYSTHSKKYCVVKIKKKKKWRKDLTPHALSEASSFTVKAPTFINGQGTFTKPSKFPFDSCCYVNCLFFLWTPSIGAHRSAAESPRANHRVPPGSPALFFNPVFCVTGQSTP